MTVINKDGPAAGFPGRAAAHPAPSTTETPSPYRDLYNTLAVVAQHAERLEQQLTRTRQTIVMILISVAAVGLITGITGAGLLLTHS